MNFWMLFLSIIVLISPLSGSQAGPKDRPTTQTKDCTAGGCHSEVTGFPFLHGTLRVGACAGCHRWRDVAKHTFELTRRGSSLCLFCHKFESGTYSHRPKTEGACLDCHNPHGGEISSHLRTKTVQALCDKCHAKVVKGRMKHRPVAQGGCQACHTPHVSNYRKLLKLDSVSVCLDCHVVFAGRMKSARTVHQPVGKDCLQCHDAHASDRPRLLKNPMRELCFSCHEDVRSTVQQANTQHGALMEMRECMNCHDPHGTRHSNLLRSDTRALCLKCHDKEIKTVGGKIRDMSRVLASGRTLHGPITIDNCSACHQIHGGDLFHLLNREYPREFYTSFGEEKYELCFSCHDTSAVLAARTTKLTGFRDGDKNLHFLHVNQKTKGRTCYACHETHAISQEKYIRDSVPFGDWMLPIRFTKTATGGSCTPGCHKRFSYDRQNPIEKTQRSEESPEGDTEEIRPEK